MYTYRKKPIVIEAFQMTKARRNDNRDWPEWLNRAWNEISELVGAFRIDPNDENRERVQIVTLEGVMLVQWDDWIIKGVKGEFYPCKPDIFEATYEKE